MWTAAAIFFIIFAGRLAWQVYRLGVRMSEPEKMIHPLDEGLSPQQQALILEHADWLAAVGLQHRCSFRFGPITVAVYQQGDAPRFFSFLFHPKPTFGVESYLADLTILDTGTSGNMGLFPRPGAFGQSFPNISPAEAWRLHLAGEAQLSRKFGYAWEPLATPYQQLFTEAVRLRMNYNRSQFLWPFRVLYRYFVTRHLIKNQTIARQFP